MKLFFWVFFTFMCGANSSATMRSESELSVLKHSFETKAIYGLGSILNFKLSFNKGVGIISFEETVSSYQMTSIYTMEVRDYENQNLLFEKRIEGNQAKVFEIPTRKLSRQGKYAMRLHVERQGANEDGTSIHFDLIYIYEKTTIDDDDTRNLRRSDQVQFLALEGRGYNRAVLIRDLTPNLEEVKSTYKLVVWRKMYGGNIQWLGEKTFTRDEISRSENELSIPLRAIDLNPPLNHRLYMDLVVTRRSDVYFGSQKVQFIVNRTF